MKRIVEFLKPDLNNRKHAKIFVIAFMNVALWGGIFINRLQAEEPPATNSSVESVNQDSASQSESEASAASEGVEKASSSKTEDAAKMQSRVTNTITLWSLFRAGGWAMWPLLAASLVGMMVVLERFYYYTVTKVTGKTFQQDLADSIDMEGLEGVKTTIDKHDGLAISNILKDGMEVSQNDPDLFVRGVEREAGSLLARAERGLPVLAAVSTIAPLIGFLGTVSGMIGAFDSIAGADSVNAKVVAGGIKEALITTAAGLIVGIPAMAFFQYFTGRVNGFATEIEHAANVVYKELLRWKSRVSSLSGGGV